jgi:hypothetical protein
MRRATAVTLVLAGLAFAAPDGWHRSMKDGIAASQKSGRPVLVVTIWPEKV